MRAAMIARAAGALVTALLCASSCSKDDGASENACEPSATRPCERDGCSGTETCAADGSAWGACVPCDVGPGAGDAGSGDGALPLVCEPGVLPPPPSIQGAGGSRTFVAAMSELSYGDPRTIVGFDLGEPACPRDSLPQAPDCAIDNALSTILELDGGFTSMNLSDLVRQGEMTTLVRVSDYTGTGDDDQVTVALLAAAPFDAFTPGATPAPDGLNDWPVASSSVDMTAAVPLNAPLYVAVEAYVSGGRLGARFDRARIRLPFGLTRIAPRAFDVVLEDVRLSCRVTRTETSWRLDACVLGGLWPVTELLVELAESPDPVMPQMLLCTDSYSHNLFLGFFCDFASWSITGSVPCDALPVGVSFETLSAAATNVFEERDLAPCAPEVDPSTDRCPSTTL